MKRAPTGVFAGILLAALSAGAQEGPVLPTGEGRPFPELKIEAKVEQKNLPDGQPYWIVSGEGDAQYPDGTVLVLEMQLEGNSGFIGSEQTFVQRGHWEKKLAPVGINIYAGKYTIRIGFDPALQSQKFILAQPNLNPGLQYATQEVMIGAPEVIAAEMKSAEQFYLRSTQEARGLFARLTEHVARQRKQPDAKDWSAFISTFSNDLTQADRRLNEWKIIRGNVPRPDWYYALSGFYATVSNFLMTAIEMSLGFNGTPTEGNAAQVAQGLEGLETTLSKLEQALAGVKIDASWTPPVKPRIDPKFTGNQNPPPGVTSFTDQPQSNNVGPQTGRKESITQTPKIGMIEGGIGLAIICGICVLVVLLKKK